MPLDRPTAHPIGKLTISVTESCPLSCQYCYVTGGDHGSRARGSRRPDAVAILETLTGLLTARRGCELLQFFGGEPTLNLPLVRRIIARVETLVGEGILHRRPRLGIVTSGVFLKSREAASWLELMRDTGMLVTVSLDGPAPIHDRLRPLKAGGASHAMAEQAITTLKGADVAVSMETVYTNEHLCLGYGMADIMDYARQLGVERLFINPAYPPASARLTPLAPGTAHAYAETSANAALWILQQMAAGRAPFGCDMADLIQALLAGQPLASADRCPAGDGTLAIDIDGSLLGCQLLANMDSLGTADRIPDTALSPAPRCKTCVIQPWCRWCPAINSRWAEAHRPHAEECAAKRHTVLALASSLAAGGLLPDTSLMAPLRQAATAWTSSRSKPP